MGTRKHPSDKSAPLDASGVEQSQLEKSIRQSTGSHPPASRRAAKGPRPTLTPPAFPAVAPPVIAAALPVVPAAPAVIPAARAVDVTAGKLDRVPVRRVNVEQARALRLDHRAGFVLSLVDGTSTVETILDICGMPRAEALRVLQDLIDKRAIALR